MGKMSRNKGKRGEREAAKRVIEWLAPVYLEAGVEAPRLERNLQQSRYGGYDLVGVDWLAVEVKRCERLQVKQWWRQTLAQCRDGQEPLLLYRGNRQPWRSRARVTLLEGTVLEVTLDEQQTALWLRSAARTRFVTVGVFRSAETTTKQNVPVPWNTGG